MSIEQSVEELYGDTWTREEKDAEVARLKAEQGIVEMDEPAVNLDAEEGDDGNSSDQEKSLEDEPGAGKGAPEAGE